MARIHLFELEDQDWLPVSLRNYGTDFLKTMAIKTKMFSPAVPLLKEVLQKSGEYRIIDVASGAGGSLLSISRELKKEFPELKVTLTDYYPNIPAYKATVEESPDIFDYVEEKVDAS